MPPKKAPAASGLNKKIDECFDRHFNHVTPGTPDHAVITAAKNDLKATLAEPAGQPDSK